MQNILLSIILFIAIFTLIISIYTLLSRRRLSNLSKLTSNHSVIIEELKNKINEMSKNKKGWK